MADHNGPVRVLLGVTGSIHAVEVPRYLQMLRAELPAEVQVVMTQAATQIIPPRTVTSYANRPVYTDLWDPTTEPGLHVTLSRWADVILVLPATANTLAKTAHGSAEDLLSTTILASESPVIFAPAMNGVMYRSRAVQRNLALLRDYGHLLIPARETLAVADGDRCGGMAPLSHTIVPFVREVLRNRSD